MVRGRDVFRFGEFELDLAAWILRERGKEIHLRAQVLTLLRFLIQNRQRVVSKDELVEHVWEGCAATDDSIAACVRELRRALSDNYRSPLFIRTYPKIGYRFVAPVECGAILPEGSDRGLTPTATPTEEQ